MGKQAKDSSIAQPAFDAVHARSLLFFPELVVELGGQAAGLLVQAGIDPAAPNTASYRQIVDLLERTARALPCPDFGLRLALRQDGTAMFGSLGKGMRNARNFGEALKFASTHSYAHSLAAGIWLTPSRSGRNAIAGHTILLDGLPNRAQAMEHTILTGHLAALELTQGQVRARRVLFRHQLISPPATYRRYFGCEVRFGQQVDGIVYSAQDLRCPIPSPDDAAYRAAIAAIEARFTCHRPPLHAHVRGIIMHFLGTGLCNHARVSAELNLHPRTLHRRLADEGTSFQQIKDEVRRDMLRYYLQQTSLDLARISERLGFAEQSVLSRRCRAWFGAPPSSLRGGGAAAL